jgi:hypothetical protein
MTINAIGCLTLLCWLMQKLDPRDMTLRIGPNKELKITKQTVHLILGLPNSGGGKPLNIDELNSAATLRSSLSISKDEFVISKLQDRLRLGNDDDLSIRCFLILFNRLLFPTTSWSISYNEVLLTEELERSLTLIGAISFSATYVKLPRNGTIGALITSWRRYTGVPSLFL